jgi:hypothetical protein
LYEAIHRRDRCLQPPGHRKDADLINGAHAILYSHDVDATRTTVAKVLRTRSVDSGGGWLIFALPPAEIAVHPATDGGRAELYLLCDDVAATVAALQTDGIEIIRPISDQGWGLLTAISLPGGVELGLTSPSTRRRHDRTELDPPQVGPLRCRRRSREFNTLSRKLRACQCAARVTFRIAIREKPIRRLRGPSRQSSGPAQQGHCLADPLSSHSRSNYPVRDEAQRYGCVTA